MSQKGAAAVKSAAAQAQRFQKYTVQPTGAWGWIYRKLAVDPERSSGVPLNPQFRYPAPGAVDPNTYDDPTTVPAADLAENPYWKRDARRRYPQLSTVNQGDVVALLTVGSKASPKDDVLQLGEAGAKQLVAVKQEGEEKGLAAFFEKQKGVSSSVLQSNGLPPLPAPTTLRPAAKGGYELLKEQSYSGEYPCRTFE